MSKIMTLEVKENLVTLKSPKSKNKGDFQAWNVTKDLLSKSVVATGGTKSAIAISPADEPSFFKSLKPVECLQCPSPYDDCYLLTTKEWPEEIIVELANSMSFSLGQLWFFESREKFVPTKENVEILTRTIERATQDDNFENSESFELFGCIADDDCIVWYRQNVSTISDALAKELQDGLNAKGIDWQIIVIAAENADSGSCV